MPLERGQVTVGASTFTVKPFHWPAAPLPIGVHEASGGRIIELDTGTRLRDVEITLEGDDETGWATMTDALRATIVTLFQTGVAFTVTDWRGNTGSFFFLEAPEWRDIVGVEAVPLTTYWGFRFRLGRTA